METVIAEITDGVPASVISLILYGSVARSEEEPFSDIDILAVTATEEDTAAVEQFFLQKNASLVPRFGNTVAALVVSVEELHSRLVGGEPLMAEIVQTGRVIYGEYTVGLLSRGVRGSEVQPEAG